MFIVYVHMTCGTPQLIRSVRTFCEKTLTDILIIHKCSLQLSSPSPSLSPHVEILNNGPNLKYLPEKPKTMFVLLPVPTLIGTNKETGFQGINYTELVL